MKKTKACFLNRVISIIAVICICLTSLLDAAPSVSALMEDDYYKKTYGVTYNELLTKYPQYLNNQSFNYILNKMDDAVSSCVEGFAAPNDDFAAWVSGLKDGLLYLVPGYDDYVLKKVSEKTTKNLVNKMSKYSVNPYDGQIKAVKEQYYKPLSNLNSAVEFIEKNELINMYADSHPKMPKKMVEEYINKIYEHENQLLSAAGNGIKIYELATIILAFEEVEYNTVFELYNVAPEHSTLKKGLAYHIENWEKSYVQNVAERYINNKLIPKIAKKVKDAGLKVIFSSESVAFGNLFWDVIISTHEWSSAEDVMEATYSYSYAKSIDSSLNFQRIKLCSGSASKSDIQTFETLWKAELAAYECALSDAKRITRNETMKDVCQTYLSFFDCGAISYDTYIEWCMAALKKDVDAGNLVLDAAPDEETLAQQSAKKIQERFASFRSRYPVGSHWYGSYGGGIQCYGFAKMCFAYIFGVDIPCYDWQGGKRYQFTDSNAVVAIGQLTGYSGASAGDVKALFSKGKLGDVIQACGGGDSQHTMIFVAAHETGVEVYDCNVDNNCGIAQYTLSYQWIADNYCTNGTSLAGVTIYRAYNYAKLLGTTAFEIIDDSANFIIDADGVLTKYTGYASVVVIPDEVTAIGDKAFQNNVNIRFVRMNDNVKSIGQYAFDGCKNLLEIDLPDSIKTIGSYAFRNCASLISVDVPELVTVINTNTWYGCSSLGTLTLSENITSINSSAFSNCTSLKSVVIPDSVTVINKSAFYNCAALSDVKLSKSLEEMYINSFGKCSSLTAIEIPKSLKTGGNDSALDGYGGAFVGCNNLKNVTFERGTTRVASYLFYKCNGIETINIPDTITSINSGAFMDCANLKDVTLSENLLTIGTSAFSRCTSLESIEIPDSVTIINKAAFCQCSSLSTIKLSNSLEKMYINSFGDCDRLTEIEIPKSLKIGGNDYVLDGFGGAFMNCGNLKNVTFENGTTIIAEYLFYKCNGIETINIPDTVTSINSGAFMNCTNLKNVTLSQKLETINNSAFLGCNNLLEIDIPDTVTSMGSGIFSGCTKLATAKLPNKRVTILKNTFYNCSSLEAIELPETVENIEDKAFYGCKSLKSVNFPSKLKTIGNQAFYDCESLETAELPDGLTSMGTECFRDCVLLESVTFGNGLKTIPTGAFRGTYVNNITLPSTVTKINDYAFAECVNLKEIVIPPSVTAISSTSVFSYPKKMTIYGAKGSAAETYAAEKSINFVELDSNAVVNSEYNISAAPVNGSLMPNLTLEVSPRDLSEDIISQVDGAVLAYNIRLMNGTKEVQPNCTVKVTVPVPNDADGARTKIFRSEANGTFTDMNAVYDPQTNTMSFETDHFSLYVFAAGSEAVITGDVDGNGVIDLADVILLGRSFMGQNPNEYAAIADMDGDGTISLADVILLGRLFMNQA